MLWNEEAGAWYDFDLINQKPRAYFTATNLAPLMFGCYNTANKSAIARKVLAYIDATGIDAFPGGIPATLRQTGEQWDYPNAWVFKFLIKVATVSCKYKASIYTVERNNLKMINYILIILIILHF